MDLDFALREDHPSDLTSASTAGQRSTMEKWERSNRMSLLIMKHSIPEAIRGAIPEETQAKAFLDQIINRFAANEKVETSTILNKLVSIRYKGKENIRECIMEMSNLVTRLKAQKLELLEDIFVHLVLISLPTQFSPFKISYNTQKEKWTLNELIAQCVKDEERLKQEKIESAHLASTSQGFGTSKKRKKDNKGNKLRFLGHQCKRSRRNKIRRSLGCLRNRMPTDGERYIYVRNGNKAAIKAIGLFRLQLDSRCTLDLEETFVVSSFRWNLIYVSCLDKFGYCCSFGNEMSQSLDVSKNFKAEFENQLSKKIKVVRSNRGDEYYGRYDRSGEQRPGSFTKYLMECGIVLQYTILGTPSQNGVAERVSSKAVAQTPYELWTSKKPSIRYLHVWGCLAEARPYKPNEKKLDSRTFIEDVELSGREPLRKVVFEEESVNIPIITTRHGHIMFDDTIQNVQSITGIQDTPEIPPAQVMEPIQVHQEVTQQPQEPQVQVPLKRSTRERRSTISDDYVVYLQEHEFDMGLEDDPILLHQMDVKTTFLNGNIDETIYMVQPENFESNDSKQLVCRLKRSIGIVQEVYLGYHKRYIDKVLSRFGMSNCALGDKLVAKGDKFSLHQCPKMNLRKKYMERFPYASAVGSLMYAQVCTRPDIAYIVGMLGRYLSNLGCLDSRRSTSSYIFMLAGGAVSWKSVKQTLIASSTMEAEFITCYEASNHGIWLWNFVTQLRIVDGIEKPLRINCDNKAAELYSKNNQSSSKSKRIDIKFLVVKERVQSLQVSIEHISINSMISDPLTKGLPPKVYHEHVTHMGVVHIDDVPV
ncbi:Retrovirus-related Pol polyprotein from transposon TNT 1-94 [Vitis vinifera]|uniref:Retrovirus-related Pol polyprotein from transposon TNT 1-94 n=1 Tax=Vitis vinifera TaxID=29760 RepID=A0A438CGY2_VITVI|nr:Retrovirus-related Pol polyprotein from transposon TNT 1-94 [Vitis vinifera]